MTEFGRVITQNEHNLHNGNFQFVEEISKRKIPLGTKGRTSILSIESMCVLRSFILCQQKKTA